MRRSPFVIAASIAGLYGVLSFQTRKPITNLAIGSAASTSTVPATPKPSQSPATTTAPVSGPRTSPPATGAPATTVAPSAARTVTGSVVQYGYGQLSVKVTLAGTRITNVALGQIQVAEQTSAIIAQEAIPILQKEVLSAQSARINGVSGATYTSEAYAQSLQAALTHAHA